MSKIDKFFHKNLTEYTAEKNQWNVPDERLWEKAKVHFPKKEKKKRKLPWLFLLFGLLIISLLVGLMNVNFTNPQNSINKLANGHSQNGNSNQENTPFSEIIDVQSKNVVDANHSVDNKLQNPIGPNNKKFVEANEDPRSNSNRKEVTTINESNNDVTKLYNDEQLSKVGIKKEQLLNVSSYEKQDKTMLEMNSSDVQNAKPGEIKQTAETMVYAKGLRPLPNPQNLIVHQSEQQTDESVIPHSQNRTLLSFAELARVQKFSLTTNEAWSPMSMSEHHLVPVNQVRIPKGELGISHMFLPITFLEGQNLGEEPGDQVIFQSEYRNINLNIRRWISPRWSIQTGIFASKVDADINIDVLFTATEDDLEAITNIEFVDIMKKSNGSQDAKVNIELRDKPTIALGDEIGLEGNVGIKLKALQMPLFIHRHWYKRKFEYFTGGGLTLEYLWGAQLETDFYMEINGQPLNAMVTQSAVDEKYADTSVYIEGGMKYYLTENVNIGITLRAAVIEPVFSGIDIGLNYRWY